MKSKLTPIAASLLVVALLVMIIHQQNKIAQLQSESTLAKSLSKPVAATATNDVAVKVSVPATVPSSSSHADQLARILKLNGHGMAEIMRAMGGFLSNIKPDEIPGLLEVLKNAPNTSTTSMIEPMLISEWAEGDPAAAIAWIHSLPSTATTERDADMQSVLQTWATSDPVAAANFALTMPDDPNFRAMVDSIVQNWSAVDPQAAWAWVQTLPPGSPQQNAERTVLTNLAKVDPHTAFSAVMDMPDDGSGIRTKIFNNVLVAWSAQDPAAAAAVIDNVPAGPTQKSAYGIVAYAWIQQDPAAAAQWINSLPASTPRDNAMKSLVAFEGKTDPADAFQSALTLQTPDIRATALNSLVQNWAKSDPAATAAAIRSANISDDERSSLYAMVSKANPAWAQANTPAQ
jgi:hypothetical protein